MVEILKEVNIKPISQEQLELEMLINIVKSNEYAYLKEQIINRFSVITV